MLAMLAAAGTGAVERISAPALFAGKAMLEIDGTRRMLRVGQTSPEGVRLVDANSRRAVVEFDGTRREIALGARIAASYQAPVRPRVQLYPDSANMYLAEAAINGFPIQMLVDTGATSVVLNASHARRLGIDFRTIGERGLASTASGIANTWFITLDRVRVGDIELRDVRAAVTGNDFPDVPLLGMTFLGRLDMRREASVLELRAK